MTDRYKFANAYTYELQNHEKEISEEKKKRGGKFPPITKGTKVTIFLKCSSSTMRPSRLYTRCTDTGSVHTTGAFVCLCASLMVLRNMDKILNLPFPGNSIKFEKFNTPLNTHCGVCECQKIFTMLPRFTTDELFFFFLCSCVYTRAIGKNLYLLNVSGYFPHGMLKKSRVHVKSELYVMLNHDLNGIFPRWFL